MNTFPYGFITCEMLFMAMWLAGNVKMRRVQRCIRRRRNLWSVQRYMMECDMISWGIK